MDQIKSEDNSVEFVMNPLLSKKFSLENSPYFEVILDEYQNELHDSKFNIMDLFEPKEINFLNLNDYVREQANSLGDFSISFKVSNKIFK